jgi:hypothetical protein
MRSRLTTLLLVAGLVVFAATGAYAASAHLGLAKAHHGKARHHKKGRRHHHGATQHGTQTQNGQSSAQSQYGTRPGKGCGDRNHTHTGPPGNPSNTSCPQQSQHQGTTSSLAAGHKRGHHARHHSRKKHGKKT